MTMTLASSTLQIRRHEYSGDFNIVILVIFVGISTLFFYAINMDVVSVHRFILFVFSEFEFVLYLYTLSIWMNECNARIKRV